MIYTLRENRRFRDCFEGFQLLFYFSKRSAEFNLDKTRCVIFLILMYVRDTPHKRLSHDST